MILHLIDTDPKAGISTF